MPRIPIALQLYSIRDNCAKDLPATLKAVAKMGYEGVDFAGYHGRSAKELRAMLDDLGLKCAGTHIGLDTLLGDKLKETMEFNRIIGNKYLIVPGLAEQYRSSRVAWKQTAEMFNDIAQKLAPAGQLTGYHNHTIEFKPLEGECPWDTFFGTARKEVVMQMDTGNCMHGDGDPIAWMKKFPGRAITVHLKEFSKTNDKAVVGEGDCKWAEFFTLCETTGKTEWYIVEQESYALPPMECVERCLQNLKKMGK